MYMAGCNGIRCALLLSRRDKRVLFGERERDMGRVGSGEDDGGVGILDYGRSLTSG